MARGRKNGCPVNIRNWLIEILDHSDDKYVRVYGLNSLSRSIDSDTEDGSSDSDAWSEPFVTKRSGKVTIKGKRVVEESSGQIDRGQELLDSYGTAIGCDGDATLRLTDPYGHCAVADYIVTSTSEDADESSNEKSWDLEQVGEAEVLPYVQVTAVAMKDGASAAETLSMNVGEPAKLITVSFTPETASNKRFRVSNSKRSVASVSNITESGFSIIPVSAGATTIKVTSVNNGKSATLNVTVASADG